MLPFYPHNHYYNFHQFQKDSNLIRFYFYYAAMYCLCSYVTEWFDDVLEIQDDNDVAMLKIKLRHILVYERKCN